MPTWHSLPTEQLSRESDKTLANSRQLPLSLLTPALRLTAPTGRGAPPMERRRTPSPSRTCPTATTPSPSRAERLQKRWHTNQVDRQYPILQGKAVKKGFGGKCEQKRADSTIFIGDEFKDSELKNILLRADYPNNWIAEAPFRRQIARDKTDVQKEGWNQSWSNTTTKMKSR